MIEALFIINLLCIIAGLTYDLRHGKDESHLIGGNDDE